MGDREYRREEREKRERESNTRKFHGKKNFYSVIKIIEYIKKLCSN